MRDDYFARNATRGARTRNENAGTPRRDGNSCATRAIHLVDPFYLDQKTMILTICDEKIEERKVHCNASGKVVSLPIRLV